MSYKVKAYTAKTIEGIGACLAIPFALLGILIATPFMLLADQIHSRTFGPIEYNEDHDEAYVECTTCGQRLLTEDERY